MRKFAFIIRLFQKDRFHGGGEKLFFNIIKRFSAQGNQIDIYCSMSDMQTAEGISNITIVDSHLRPFEA